MVGDGSQHLRHYTDRESREHGQWPSRLSLAKLQKRHLVCAPPDHEFRRGRDDGGQDILGSESAQESPQQWRCGQRGDEGHDNERRVETRIDNSRREGDLRKK